MFDSIYKTSLALLTDLYQLTMSYGYFKSDMHNREAVFHMFYRKNPFNGGYAIACGLEQVMEYLESLRFDCEDLQYLSSLTGADGKPLFDENFINYLSELKITLDIDAVEEGNVVFPNEPLLRVQGPLLQCQLVETAILNIINFQTLIATKSARITNITKDEPVLEFGLRRAQGIDGSVSAARAAFIGGCAATSNVLAGKLLDIPVKGTHAHSWIMSFETEIEAFRQYSKIMPNNCIFLVDTYNSIQGIENAIEMGKKLQEIGHKMLGIRLDSGNLAELSIKARKMLDDAGFKDVSIVASNDLDEYSIKELKNKGAVIDVWGVGTRLTTAYGQPALGGVYKISAIKDHDGQWQSKLKKSDDNIKTSNPGLQQVRRYYKNGIMEMDIIYDRNHEPEKSKLFYFNNHGIELEMADEEYCDLLISVMRDGKSVYKSPDIRIIQQKAKENLSKLEQIYKLNDVETSYSVFLEKELFNEKRKLIDQFS